MNNSPGTLNIFREPHEKGGEEWSACGIVRHDKLLNAYPVTLPKHPLVLKEHGHILRIVYPYNRMLRGA